MPVVAIVGRPNVGKSTLFNRLAGRRLAIVEDVPGVTRDRLYADLTWRGVPLTVVDTGGLVPEAEEPLARQVARQVAVATDEADVVVLVVDAREGLTPADGDLARRLRRLGKPVIVAANKVDSAAQEPHAAEFHALGLGEPVPVSAQHGRGVGELLDRIVAALPPAPADGALPGPPEADGARAEETRIAIVGRPNVGKSSLLNRLVGEERAVVSEVPGTTRDAVDVVWEGPLGRVVFIDTAGLRRRSRVREPVEFYAGVRTRHAIERCHLALVVLDATELVTDQDKRIAGLVEEHDRAAVFVVNKWDLAGAGASEEAARQRVHDALPTLRHVEVVCVSALTGAGIDRLLQAAGRAAANFRRRLQTSLVNRLLQDAVLDRQPPSVGGRRLKIRYATQVRTEPPTLLVFVNDPELVVPHYRRYLEHRLRAAVDLTGTPVRLVFRSDG